MRTALTCGGKLLVVVFHLPLGEAGQIRSWTGRLFRAVSNPVNPIPAIPLHVGIGDDQLVEDELDAGRALITSIVTQPAPA